MKKKILVMVSPVSAPRINGIARYAREHDWHLVIQDRMGTRPLAWDGDGVIVTLRADNAAVNVVRKIRGRGIPVIDMTIDRPEIALPRVMSDHEAIGRMAAEHFAERNFRNLAWFSTGWGHVHELRYSGFTEKTQAAKWVATQALPKARQDSYAAFFKWISSKLKNCEKPLGVLTYDEADGAKLLNAAEETGLSVPEEVAILSIGNDPIICENQSVPLSSIDQDLENGGYEAARFLDALMRGKATPREGVIIPPKGIALRRSTDTIASSDPIVRQALAFIAGNIPRQFGIAQISDALGITRNMLDKHFRADMNRSIGDEISRQRIAFVKTLLRDTDKTLVEIADRTGFCNQSHLANVFRHAVGCTPSAWRRKHKG